MNIYQKLIEVRKSVPYLQKENKGYQFNYVSSSQVLAGLKSKMDEMGLLLIPSVKNKFVTIDTYDKEDNRGNTKRTVDYFTELELTYTWVNTDNPEEKIECQWYGQGVDTAGEKGVGKALTYAEKYFMLKFFNIPTDKDDPDSFQGKQDDPPQQGQHTSPTKGGNVVNMQSGGTRQQQAGSTKGVLTEPQVKRAFAIAAKSGITPDQVVEWISKSYKKQFLNQLTKAEYDELCTAMENAKGAK